MRVGVIVDLVKDADISEKFREVKAFGMESCQLVCWDRAMLKSQVAEQVNQAVAETGVEITAFWCGWEGPRRWDFYDGQLTLGLIPTAYRFERMNMLLEGSDFAKLIHADKLVTHAGYMPENPYDPAYQEVIVALKQVVRRCRENGQSFLFETGQETPITLKRAIEDLGGTGVGINLDPANLLMYGKANPVDALDVFGEYVMGIHGKDGQYPTNGRELGHEVPLGQGKVNFPVFLKKLKALGYDGDITIEREISGKEQQEDIRTGKVFLEKLIGEI